MAYIPNPNQSVSGTVGASIVGLPPFKLGESTNASVITVGTAAPNQSVSGTVGASVIGHAPVVIVGGSILTSSTANQSVSGSVGIEGTPTFLQLAGSILATSATVTPAANQSVSGTVGASIIGLTPVSVTFPTNQNVSGSVVAFQGTPEWTVKSSLAGGIFPVSGSVAATITNTNLNVGGSVVAFQGAGWSGSVAAVQAGTRTTSIVSTVPSSVIVGTSMFGQLPAGTAPLGSVATLQGTNPWITQPTSGSIFAMQVAGSVMATSATVNMSNSSVMLLNGGNMIGSVAAYQGSIPWTIGSVYGNIGGSVVAFQGGTRMTSIVSTTPSSVQVGASIMGIAPVTLTANTVPPAASILVGATANTNGSVLTTTGYPQAVLQITSGPGASMTGALNFEGTIDGTQFVPIQGYNLATNAISSMATVESDWAFNTAGLQGIRARLSNWSVGSVTARAVLSPSDARPFATTGSVISYQAGTWSASVMTNVITSIATAGQVMGSVATLQGTNPWNVAGSVAAFVVGSASLITVWKDSSILSVPVGSTIAVLQGASIVGTYAEDAAHATGDKGLAVWGVRNDTLASVTSADGDYSPHIVGPVGELIVANSPITKWVQGTASMLGGTPVTGGSVAVIAAQGASVFTYITGIQVMNASANNVWLRFDGATSSIVGFTMVPANGGSNIVLPNAWKTNANAAFTASISGVASVYLTAEGFISKV